MEDRKATDDVPEGPALLRSLADFLEQHNLTDDRYGFAFGDEGYLSGTVYDREALARWERACATTATRLECFNCPAPFVAYNVTAKLPGQSQDFSVLFADHDEAKRILAEAERSALSDAEDEAWLESKPEPEVGAVHG